MEFTERYLDLYVNKLINQVKRSLHDHNMGIFHQRPHNYHFTLLMCTECQKVFALLVLKSR